MEAKIKFQLVLAAICMSAMGAACAGVIERAGTSGAWDGKFISCHAPEATLGVVRGTTATTVFQATPTGIAWKYVLPETTAIYDQIWAAPDGTGAVVALTIDQGGASRNFYVAKSGPVEVNGGLVAVDVQGDRVLIVTAGPKGDHAYRARVFQRTPWRLVGDSTFAADFGDDFRRFSVRLAGDGQSYYYLDGAMAPNLRDAVTGQQMPLGAAFPRGGIDDLLLDSSADGFVVAGNQLYVLGPDHAMTLIPTPDRQPVESLVETEAPGLQAVRFAYGWGMLDRAAKRWLKVSSDPVSSIQSNGVMLTVVNSPAGKDSIEVFDFSGRSPTLVGNASSPAAAQAVACVNPFGYMRYVDGAFEWHRLGR